MSNTPRTIARAEPVGSLLRAPDVTKQINTVYAGMTTGSPRFLSADRAEAYRQLRSVADDVVADLVRRQVDAGLDVVTDGEIRRTTFLSSFYDAVDGMTPAAEKIRLVDDEGRVLVEGYNDPLVDRRIHKAANPLIDEIPALERADSPVPYKLTIPAPSYFLTAIVAQAESTEYASRLDFLDDVVEITRQIVAEAVAAGARWIQFDFPIYPALADSHAAELAQSIGTTPEVMLERSLIADRRAAEDLPDDVTVAMHICRGNVPGGFWHGSLEPVAERMFGELPHERWLIEWEDIEREGDFSPLRHVPKGKVIALGLVSSKIPDLESEDAVVAQIEDAAGHLALDQLALCPQCGFASLALDSNIGAADAAATHANAEDVQWRKLALVGSVADRVWGRS